jgi:hypothetical protein
MRRGGSIVEAQRVKVDREDEYIVEQVDVLRVAPREAVHVADRCVALGTARSSTVAFTNRFRPTAPE